MSLTVSHLQKTLDTLEQALKAIEQETSQSSSYDLYRNAAIKSFELSLETAGKLLRKALKGFESSPQVVDRWVFNDVLRQAGKRGLIEAGAVSNWLAYRKNRNTTAHDYGESFANETLALLPNYLNDARHLAAAIQRAFDAQA